MGTEKKKLIIYGDSSYAEMLAHYFNTDSDYCVVAYCVDEAYQSREEIGGLRVVPLEQIEKHFSPKDHYIFAAIGYKSVRMHKALFEKIEALPYPIASYISQDAIVDSTCRIGVNCLILPGVILEPHVVVEKNVFINSGATVCHHAVIKAHSVLAAKSLVGGYVTVGACSLIGFHATVTELLQLGEETLLGAGSVLLQDTNACTLYAGTPAKAIREHAETGIVLKVRDSNH